MRTPTPRRFRKVNRHALRPTYEHKRCVLRFGTHGLQATEGGFVTAQQLEAVRRTVTRRLSRKRKIWLRAVPDFPRTAKPKEVRRGRGKGAVSEWVCVVKPGRILLEAGASPRDYPRLLEALAVARRKLPVFVQLVTRSL
jgi:large subunit ribosomal protein L16